MRRSVLKVTGAAWNLALQTYTHHIIRKVLLYTFVLLNAKSCSIWKVFA